MPHPAPWLRFDVWRPDVLADALDLFLGHLLDVTPKRFRGLGAQLGKHALV